MSVISSPKPALVREAKVIHCTCFHRARSHGSLRVGIRVAAAAGMIYAGYVAYQRNMYDLENVSAAITWFADRLRNEVETQKRLDELSSQLKAAEQRAKQLQHSLDKLSKVCGREITPRRPATPSVGRLPWLFFGGQ